MPIAPIRLRPSMTSSGIFASRSICSGSTSFSRNARSVARKRSPFSVASASSRGCGWIRSRRKLPRKSSLPKLGQLPFLLARGLGDLPGLALADVRRGHPLITAQLRAVARRLNRPHAPDASPSSPPCSSSPRPPTPPGRSSGSPTTGSCSPAAPQADEAVAEWADLGVQQVRIYALWSRIAPNHARAATYDWAPARPRRRPRRRAPG